MNGEVDQLIDKMKTKSLGTEIWFGWHMKNWNSQNDKVIKELIANLCAKYCVVSWQVLNYDFILLELYQLQLYNYQIEE